MARAIAVGLLLGGAVACAHGADGNGLWARGRDTVARIWQAGDSDFYLPLHTHHLRFAYERAKIDSYQENPLGLGYGRSLYQDGIWRGLYCCGSRRRTGAWAGASLSSS